MGLKWHGVVYLASTLILLLVLFIGSQKKKPSIAQHASEMKNKKYAYASLLCDDVMIDATKVNSSPYYPVRY